MKTTAKQARDVERRLNGVPWIEIMRLAAKARGAGAMNDLAHRYGDDAEMILKEVYGADVPRGAMMMVKRAIEWVDAAREAKPKPKPTQASAIRGTEELREVLVERRAEALRDAARADFFIYGDWGWLRGESTSWDTYSKGWHRKYGPARSVTGTLKVSREALRRPCALRGQAVQRRIVLDARPCGDGMTAVVLCRGRGKSAKIETVTLRRRGDGWKIAR